MKNLSILSDAAVKHRSMIFAAQFIRSTLVLGVLASNITPAVSAPIAPSEVLFDGRWSILIVTEKGTCDRAYRYPIKIENGVVGYAGNASFSVQGKVGDRGNVTVIVARGSQSATGTGRMSGTDGSGTWSAGSGDCSGIWTAERRS